MTLALPGGRGGVPAVIVVVFTTTTLVASDTPNVTFMPGTKFVPVIAMFVPPDRVPVFGLTAVSTGGGIPVVDTTNVDAVRLSTLMLKPFV
jgi:hypothetical protein